MESDSTFGRDLVAEGKRICSKCRKAKPAGAFYRSRIHTSGFDPRCSHCYAGNVSMGVTRAELAR
jgi:hypothetical protein